MARINRCRTCRAEVRPCFDVDGSYLELGLNVTEKGQYILVTVLAPDTYDEGLYLAIDRDSKLGRHVRGNRPGQLWMYPPHVCPEASE